MGLFYDICTNSGGRDFGTMGKGQGFSGSRGFLFLVLFFVFPFWVSAGMAFRVGIIVRSSVSQVPLWYTTVIRIKTTCMVSVFSTQREGCGVVHFMGCHSPAKQYCRWEKLSIYCG